MNLLLAKNLLLLVRPQNPIIMMTLSIAVGVHGIATASETVAEETISPAPTTCCPSSKKKKKKSSLSKKSTVVLTLLIVFLCLFALIPVTIALCRRKPKMEESSYDIYL